MDNQPTLKLFPLMRTSLRETVSFDGFFHIWIFNNRFISCVISEWNMLDHEIRGIVILTSYRNMLKFERPPKEETYNIYDSECWNKVVTKTTRMILTQLDTLNSLLSCNIEDEIAVHYFHSTSYKVTHFSPVSHFYTLWKRQKTFGFLTFSGGIEMFLEKWINDPLWSLLRFYFFMLVVVTMPLLFKCHARSTNQRAL